MDDARPGRRAIVYLHGFLSSPRSRKATMLGDYVRNLASDVAYVVPELHHRPRAAIAQVGQACEPYAPRDLTLVGSSLGGYYATVMAERLGCRAALLNPAVHPHRHFARYLGPQRNLYTGEAFDLTVEHIGELMAMDPPAITRPGRYWLFVETGDEVLDYREAVAFYAGACQTVVQGGDHALASFPEHVPDIVAWAREPAGAEGAVP
ncbi:MAG TPA: YqiA/YcfP family alpha/beta fold hydrolase [Usitatibacter sp.]|nr:YqiA/YcfP family alpha/beta fold hydrolase [Usitatibacter sp.]